jgi:hypothetical protein
MGLILAVVAVSVLAIFLALRKEKKFVKEIRKLNGASNDLRLINEKLASLEVVDKNSFQVFANVITARASHVSDLMVEYASVSDVSDIKYFDQMIFGLERERSQNIDDVLESFYEINVRSKRYLTNVDLLGSKAINARIRSSDSVRRPLSGKYFEPRSCYG